MSHASASDRPRLRATGPVLLRTAAAAAIGALGLMLSACKDATHCEATGSIAHAVPGDTTVGIGATFPVRLEITDGCGFNYTTHVGYTVDHPEIVQLKLSGVNALSATAIATGTAVITASAQYTTHTMTITVQ